RRTQRRPRTRTRRHVPRHRAPRDGGAAMTALSLRRRLLILLADEGMVEHPAGHVTTVLAGMLDTTASRVGEVLRQAAAQGLVEVHRNKISGRTFRACLTDAGRAEVG